MTEKLIVRDFAGLQHVELDIAKINVLIGPQASGKSVLAKLLFYFRGVWRALYAPTDQNETFEERKDKLKENFRRYFPVETWGNSMFSFVYEIDGCRVALRRGPSPSKGKPSPGLILQLPEFSEELFAKLKPDSGAQKTVEKRMDLYMLQYRAWRGIQDELVKKLAGGYFHRQLFIPAGRAFFSNIEANVFSFIARSEGKLDPFLAEFGEYYSFYKTKMRSEGGTENAFRDRVLKGKLVIERNNEYVSSDHDRRIPLANLSSGQQELLPLLMMLEGDDDPSAPTSKTVRNGAIYIEEPEAHLFPEYQRLTVEHIIGSCSVLNTYQSIFLTTHSPYVLSALNNLLFAGIIGGSSKNGRQGEIASAVPRELWIRADDLRAYSIDNGEYQNIIDKETGLINAEYIDSVSTSIGETFDKLLAIDSKKN